MPIINQGKASFSSFGASRECTYFHFTPSTILFEYIRKFLSKFEMAPIGYRKMPIFRTPPLISDKSGGFTVFLATGKVIDKYKIFKLLN